MEVSRYEKIIRVVGVLIISGLLIGTTVSAVKSYQLRRLCNQLRERIAVAEDTNRRLGETVGQCKSICGELGASVDRNIRTAREAVELIEEIRVQVQCLENITGGWDSDSYYSYWDSVYGIE